MPKARRQRLNRLETDSARQTVEAGDGADEQLEITHPDTARFARELADEPRCCALEALRILALDQEQQFERVAQGDVLELA